MINKATKKLIIVCDERTEEYANYLRQLISTKDDKDGAVVGVEDGTVDAAVWLEKEYSSNKVQISSNTHVLFVGEGKISKKETSTMIVKFEKFGMKYGWLGKRGMMVVDKVLSDPDQYDEFIDFCLGYETEFEKVAFKKPVAKEIAQKPEEFPEAVEDNQESPAQEEKEKQKPNIMSFAEEAVKDTAATANAIVNRLPKVFSSIDVSSGINKVQTHKKVRDQQYRALAVIMYIDGLKAFLEG